MPEYEHKCRACGHEFTIRKPIVRAGRDEQCPECGGAAGRRWTAAGLRGAGCRTSGPSGRGPISPFS